MKVVDAMLFAQFNERICQDCNDVECVETVVETGGWLVTDMWCCVESALVRLCSDKVKSDEVRSSECRVCEWTTKTSSSLLPLGVEAL